MENKMIDLVNAVYGDKLTVTNVIPVDGGFEFSTKEKVTDASDFMKETEEAFVELITNGYHGSINPPISGGTVLFKNS